MTAAITQLPILSQNGHSVSNNIKYKRLQNTGMLSMKKTTITLHREINQSEKREVSPLKKIGAFGNSVKNGSLSATTDYSKNEQIGTDEQNQLAEQQQQDVKRLPPVTISIQKIKRRIMLRHVSNTETLASADKQVIDELRHDLRTNKIQEAEKSVLEAIGNPKVRESRFYHEPMKRYLAANEKQKIGKHFNKIPYAKPNPGYVWSSLGYPPDIRLMNVSVPPSQHHFNTPVDTRHTVSSHYQTKKSRAGVIHNFPRVSNTHIGARMVPKEGRIPAAQTAHNLLEYDNVKYALSPSRGLKTDTEAGSKMEFSLPSISLHVQQEQAYATVNRDCSIKRKTQTVESVAMRQYKAGKLKTTTARQNQSTRAAMMGYSGVLKTTASGKSHLIGPMNKMDMIVEYSKLLQNKIINYNQYIKKLSILSLHKIDLGNNGLRQYHIVRGGTTGMKPRLARVDIFPTSQIPTSNEKNAEYSSNTRGTVSTRNKREQTSWTKEKVNRTADGRLLHNQRTSTIAQSRAEYSRISGATPHQDNPSPYKAGHIRLNRISIGEGIPESRFESYSGYDVGEYLTYDDVIRLQGTDMERYRHAHHPHSPEKQGYHWTHLRSQENARATTHGVTQEIYAGYAEKIPGSREIKKRLNFSYPSYDIVVDGATQMASLEKKPDRNKNAGKLEQKQENDPDYLAITLEQPPPEHERKMTSFDREQGTSSLSVHDVTIPTEVKVITTSHPQNGGMKKRGLGARAEPRMKDATSSPMKGSFETLNINPVGLTSASIIDAKPTSSKSVYYISEDEFASSGTDGVLQSHLSTIYKSINRAKTNKVPDSEQGKKQMPEILVQNIAIKTLTTNTFAANQEGEGRSRPAIDNQPENVSLNIEQAWQSGYSTGGKAVMSNDIKSPDTSSSDAKSESHLRVRRDLPGNSPPPTASLIRAREDEVTSGESDDGMNNVSDVISVNVTTCTDRPESPNKLNNTEIRLLTSSMEKRETNKKSTAGNTPRLEVVITSLPSAPPGSAANSSDYETDTEQL